MRNSRLLYAGILVPALAIGLGLWSPIKKAKARSEPSAPKYRVDPFWPKPLPTNATGRQWVTGEPGGSCIDSKDHVFTVNRGWQTGGLVSQDGSTAIGSPPVLEYDPEGNVVNAWGDESKNPDGSNRVLPHNIHGCFIDHQDNIWIAGNGDGVVQKWTHDGSRMLLQIGQKGVCDGPLVPTRTTNPTCGSPGFNTSKTLLNDPAEVVVDPGPDPVTGQRGSVYIADGYGNHRVVVFSSTGTYLRQWGSAGSGPGQFGLADGGHPHCIALGRDGLIYTCDRGQNRIEVFEKNPKNCTAGPQPVCEPVRIIPLTIPTSLRRLGNLGTLRATDIAFSPDRNMTWMYDTDLGNNAVWILNRRLGTVVSGFGQSGHMAGEFIFPHTIDVDSKGTIYVAETINGRRIQKFVRIDSEDED
jgi:sugar lactone lactonase YvrE